MRFLGTSLLLGVWRDRENGFGKRRKIFTLFPGDPSNDSHAKAVFSIFMKFI